MDSGEFWPKPAGSGTEAAMPDNQYCSHIKLSSITLENDAIITSMGICRGHLPLPPFDLRLFIYLFIIYTLFIIHNRLYFVAEQIEVLHSKN